jgi:CRP-like cAMP-binding protein
MEVSFISGGWLDCLPAHIQAELKSTMIKKHSCDGELIYAIGDRANESYFVDSGYIKLSNFTSEGKEYIVTLMGPGNCFGEQGSRRSPGLRYLIFARAIAHEFASQ